MSTEMIAKDGMDKIFRGIPTLKPDDISQAVLYTLGTPEHVQVHEITVRPFDLSKLDIKQKIRSKI